MCSMLLLRMVSVQMGTVISKASRVSSPVTPLCLPVSTTIPHSHYNPHTTPPCYSSTASSTHTPLPTTSPSRQTCTTRHFNLRIKLLMGQMIGLERINCFIRLQWTRGLDTQSRSLSTRRKDTFGTLGIWDL